MEQTLLLNASYEPLKVVHWQKAITLWCQGKVEVISVYDREIRAVSFSFKLPSVIRLLRYIKIKRRFDYVPFSRANIYARDDHRCQYCGEAFPTSELTFDHVVPVAQGGRKDWENIVTCCVTCNRRKGGRTPAEAGMHLLRHAEASGLGAGDPHHRRAPQRARELARLPLLERRARRHVTAASPVADLLDASRRHRRRSVRSGRSKAAASPSTATDFPSIAGAARRPRSASRPARVVFASPTALAVIVPAGPRGRPHAGPRRRSAGRDRVRRRRRAARDRPAPGRQPGLRSRRQPLRHLQRHARPAGAGLDLPRAPERHARAVRRRASSTRRRWRSIRDGRLYVSSRFEGSVYRVDAGRQRRAVRARDLGVACGLAFAPDGTLFVGDRSGTIFRVDRDGTRDDVRVAAGERRRVSPRVRPGRRAVRDGADAVAVRRVYRIAPDGDGRRRCTPAFGRPQGLAFDADGHAATSSTRWRARAASIALPPDGDARTGARGPGAGRPRLRSRAAALVVASNDTAYRLYATLRCAGLRRRAPAVRHGYNPRRMTQLFQRKPIAALRRRHDGAHGAEARARRRRSDHAGDRRGDRRRHLRRDRHGGGRAGRARTAR